MARLRPTGVAARTVCDASAAAACSALCWRGLRRRSPGGRRARVGLGQDARRARPAVRRRPGGRARRGTGGSRRPSAERWRSSEARTSRCNRARSSSTASAASAVRDAASWCAAATSHTIANWIAARKSTEYIRYDALEVEAGARSGSAHATTSGAARRPRARRSTTGRGARPGADVARTASMKVQRTPITTSATRWMTAIAASVGRRVRRALAAHPVAQVPEMQRQEHSRRGIATRVFNVSPARPTRPTSTAASNALMSSTPRPASLGIRTFIGPHHARCAARLASD